MKLRPCHIDDRATGGECIPEGLYVYQNVRIGGGRPLMVDRYAATLRRAAADVMGVEADIDERVLSRRIADLLDKNGYPSDMAAYVTVRYYLSGETVLLGGDILPYSKVSARRVFPSAAVVDYDIPFSDQPSSLSLAAGQTALQHARAAGADIAVRRNSGGIIVSAGDAPIFIVEGRRVISSSASVLTADLEAVAEAVAAAGFELHIDDITSETLAAADEVFFADCRGITALSRCGRNVYMHIIASRIGEFL